MQSYQVKRLRFVLSAFGLLFIQLLLASCLALWVLQLLAMSFDVQADWAAIFWHILLSLTFLVLFPGQNFWTLEFEDEEGRLYTIVGEPSAPD